MIDLDKDNPTATITCNSCRAPLWRFEVLSKFSNRAVPASAGVPALASMAYPSEPSKDMPCPLCSRPVTTKNADGGYSFLMLDRNGNRFTL